MFPAVTIQNDQIFVGNEKFLVVGVGYEPGCRPGQLPFKRSFEPQILRADFERIRDAGFNTIRTWAPLMDSELDLAAEYGLWVIQGLWCNPGADFNDPHFRQETFDFYEREIRRMARHPNILFYLLLNEPHGEAVFKSGPDNVTAFYRELVARARSCDPRRSFAYSNCVATDFMPPDPWDIVALNVYPYYPGTIEKALGYRTYLEIMKARWTGGRPLVITEFGLSVSPRGDWRGYGDNTLEEQRDGVVQLWDAVLNAGCAGGCAFMWVDGWWKAGDEHTHNDHAEEWYGLLEADSEYRGRPRPVYYAMQEYNRAIRTQPRDGAAFAGPFSIEVWAPEAAAVQYRIDDGPWLSLKRDGPWWWRGAADARELAPGDHYFWTRALGADGCPAGVKQAVITADQKPARREMPLTVEFLNLPARASVNEPLRIEVMVRDAGGQAVSGKLARVERFVHTRWAEAAFEAETDAAGIARGTLPALTEPGICSLAAGVVYHHDLVRRRVGDYRHILVGMDR